MKNKQTRREFGATALSAIAASVLPAPFVWAAEKKYDAELGAGLAAGADPGGIIIGGPRDQAGPRAI